MSLCVLLAGTRGSEKRTRKFRAVPDIEGGAWFDHVCVNTNLGRGREVEYAAKIICFVEVNKRRGGNGKQDNSGLYAFVKYFVDALPEDGRKEVDKTERRRYCNDLSVTHIHTHLPYVKFDPDEDVQNRYGLIDVSTIDQGLWVQQDFINDTHYWVITDKFYK